MLHGGNCGWKFGRIYMEDITKTQIKHLGDENCNVWNEKYNRLGKW